MGKKKDKSNRKTRLVIDYRNLNEVTETVAFPMPDLEEEISKMNGAKFFTTLDLHSTFHQIPLRISDRPLTSFQTNNQKYQFKRMPFGLKGSPSTWQKVINTVLGDLVNKNVMSYMDDIICHDDSFESHIKTLKTILSNLRENNL